MLSTLNEIMKNIRMLRKSNKIISDKTPPKGYIIYRETKIRMPDFSSGKKKKNHTSQKTMDRHLLKY